MTVRPRVRLCAIARNEAASLGGWVAHHLAAGFDGIEIALNGCDDDSEEILRRIGARHPEVVHTVADDLLARCLAAGENFQHRAYRVLARRAARQAFSHVAFLDLDEYWMAREPAGRIGDFLPADPDVNVVSFPWLVDLPDNEAEPFRPAITLRGALQADPHVKSVVRLDDRVTQWRTHTARTSAGERLLVDRPFPLIDQKAQQWGSVVPPDHFTAHADTAPAAFVLHAMHRSPVEYVASLANGLRQTGVEREWKDNRRGFLPASGVPVLDAGLDPAAEAAYGEAVERFVADCGLTDLIVAARAAVRARGARVLAAAVASPDVMRQLRRPLRGIASPELDAAYPDWGAQLRGQIDGLDDRDGERVVWGWVFVLGGTAPVELAHRSPDGGVRPLAEVAWGERADVTDAISAAPPRCGFVATLGTGPGEGETLLARAVGAYFWEELPLTPGARLPA